MLQQYADDIQTKAPLRHDWSKSEVAALFEQPLMDLLYAAAGYHRRYFDPNAIQLSTLLNIKSGGCPEDCAYCPQSARYVTGVDNEPMLSVAAVSAAAARAKAAGATRFCMGAAWRSPKDRDLAHVVEMVKAVKAIGLETCVTLGMLDQCHARDLKAAGLDYYNHNLDTSPEFYGEIITTRTYRDRLDTLDHVRRADINVCCGGIVGIGEARGDRAELLRTLANLPRHPESVPINMLVRVDGTPLARQATVDPIEFVRTIAVARVLMPSSWVRLSAGRTEMSAETQALCFFAGANSIFYGEQLLTTPNPISPRDRDMFARLGLKPALAH